jgi:hypothetical protein
MKELQDEKMKEDLQRSFENKGVDPEKASELADQETKRARLETTMNERGTPRVDNLTAMGGGTTGFVGPAVDEKGLLKEIDKKAEAQNELLREIKSQGANMMTLAQTQLSDAR